MSTPWATAVHDAACADVDPVLFYGSDEYDEPVDQRQWRQRRAIQVCDDCPVRTQCLVNELTRPVNKQYGVRGGMSAGARRRLLSRWRKAGLIPAQAPGSHDVVENLLDVRGRSAS